MNHGKQLRLFLPEGTPSGPRYYELVNWTGQALAIPVTRLKELLSGDWPEFERPGVYLVRGFSEEGHPRLYIGESENVANRVQGHPSKLDFDTTEILLFSSKDDNLTKSHVLWLETQLIMKAEISKRIVLANTKKPPLKQLSKAEEATMIEFLQNLELIAQTAGFYFFKPAIKSTPSPEGLTKFYLSKAKNGITATGLLTDEGFVVLEGSQASKTTTPTLSKGYLLQREELFEKKVLSQPENDHPIFLTDSVFTSPSAAAAIITGYPTSGPKHWKTAEGISLGDS